MPEGSQLDALAEDAAGGSVLTRACGACEATDKREMKKHRDYRRQSYATFDNPHRIIRVQRLH